MGRVVRPATRGLLVGTGVRLQLRASSTGPSEAIGTAYWRLGNDSLSGWSNAPTGLNSTYLNGGMQYAALYTTALIADQVQVHYRAGVC